MRYACDPHVGLPTVRTKHAELTLEDIGGAPPRHRRDHGLRRLVLRDVLARHGRLATGTLAAHAHPPAHQENAPRARRDAAECRWTRSASMTRCSGAALPGARRTGPPVLRTRCTGRATDEANVYHVDSGHPYTPLWRTPAEPPYRGVDLTGADSEGARIGSGDQGGVRAPKICRRLFAHPLSPLPSRENSAALALDLRGKKGRPRRGRRRMAGARKYVEQRERRRPCRRSGRAQTLHARWSRPSGSRPKPPVLRGSCWK